MKFPSAGIVYDYRLEDGGVSRRRKNRDDDEDDQKAAVVSSVSFRCCLKRDLGNQFSIPCSFNNLTIFVVFILSDRGRTGTWRGRVA